MAFDSETKFAIAEQLQAGFVEISLLVDGLDEKVLFKKVPGKWNIAQQLDHLTIANTLTAVGFNMPIPVLKSLFGTSKRNSYSYDEIVFRYQSKLSAGAKASFAFQPKLSVVPKKRLLLSLWHRSADAMNKALQKWDDDELDKYQIGHPILGKITMREILYFTIYHLQHHLQSMKLLVG